MAMKVYSAFPKLQHYWNLTIRLFSVISGHSLEGVLPLCIDSVSVLYSPSHSGKEYLRDWRNGKKMKMPFAISMVWGKIKDHIMDCCFCIINLKGINFKNKYHVQYPGVSSVIWPIPHGPDLPVLEPDGNMEYSSDSDHRDMILVVGGWHIQVRRGRPARTHNTSRTQWYYVWTFKRGLPSGWVYISKKNNWGCPRCVMVKAMDCGTVVREFVFQSRYYVHFRANTLGKGMNPLILPAMG